MFLATTALDHFWDRSDEMLFLGQWCKLYNNKNGWHEVGNARVMKYPFDDPATKRQSSDYCDMVAEELLVGLAGSLNKIHELDKDLSYWRIVAGSWLQQYVTIVYDRYTCLKQALQEHPDFNTILLDESCYITANDQVDFLLLCRRTDIYNLQLYSQILRGLGHSFQTKKIAYRYHCLIRTIGRKNKKPWILNTFYNFCFFNCRGDKTALSGLGLSMFSMLRILFESNFDLVPMLLPRSTYPDSIRIDESKRNRLAAVLRESSDGENEFKKILIKLLPMNLPRVFLEGFASIKNTIQKVRMKPKALLCDGGIKLDIQQLILAAEMVSNGGKIICLQHGGGYATYAVSQTKQWEIKVSHKFFSWGWTDKECPNVQPLPKSCCRGNLKRPANRQKNKYEEGKFLFVGGMVSRYSQRLESLPAGPQAKKYLAWQLDFFAALPMNLRKKFLARLYRVDFGWSQAQRLKDSFPEVQIDKLDKTFHKRLETAELVVVDFNATTYLEALALNIPTIIFWDPTIWGLHERAIPCFNELARVGIYHLTAQSAAKKVMEVHENPAQWWEKSEVQRAVELFVDKFARTHKVFSLDYKRNIRPLLES